MRHSRFAVAFVLVAIHTGVEAGEPNCYIWQDRPYVVSHPRVPGELVFDSGRGVAVFVGRGQTWEWDGAAWGLRDDTTTPFVTDHALAYDSVRGVTVLFGGWAPPNWSLSGETWEWDGEAWALKSSEGPSARAYHAMAYDAGRGVTVLYGGANGSTVWEWDGSAWSERQAALPGDRFEFHELIYHAGLARTLLFGGLADRDIWAWDGADWQLLDTQLPADPLWPTAVYDESRASLLLVESTNGSAWKWDGKAWTPLPKHPVAAIFGDLFDGYSMTFDPLSSAVLSVVVEHPGYGPFVAGTFEWDGAAWRPCVTTEPAPRIIAAMTYDSVRGTSLMFGGRGRNQLYLGDAWQWDGFAWKLLSLAGPWRQSPAMTFDRARGVAVLFGGNGPDYSPLAHCCAQGDTWEWDGESWSFRTNRGPPPRYGAALAYDEVRGVSVLFGGFFNRSGEPFRWWGDTWEWDGTAWHERLEAGPPARSGHAMVYDRRRQVIVLFGGSTESDLGSSTVSSETWEWDGSLWLHRADSGPPPRAAHVMFFDEERGVTVLHGGSGDHTLLSDTWEWDGAVWTYQGVQGEPRSSSAAAYDELRGGGVVFGGYDWDLNFGGTQTYGPGRLPDIDDDCDFDLIDFAAFQACFAGIPLPGECEAVDWNDDAAIGLSDFAAMIELQTGPVDAD